MLNSQTQMTLVEIKKRVRAGQKMAFVSGNFNVIHPGHLRLLRFAADCADFLVVAVNPDQPNVTHVPQELRVESLRSISLVDFVIALETLKSSLEEVLTELKPQYVVKGKEYEDRHNLEKDVLDRFGGKLIFGSGEVQFSSIDLLTKEFKEAAPRGIVIPNDFPQRKGFHLGSIVETLAKFSKLKVVVIGDLIVDKYVSCEPLGMSQEDPVIVVSPILEETFVGGAGIVAAHAKSLGAKVNFLTVLGNDETGGWVTERLKEQDIEFHSFLDESRPTTLKVRYRGRNSTLFRVSHLKQHSVSKELASQIFKKFVEVVDGADLVIMLDFNYGCLPKTLIESISKVCREKNIPIVADCQSSSQVGDVSKYQGTLLITPTEHEARLSLRDNNSGLAVIANNLIEKTQSEHLFVTLGAEGILIVTRDHGSGLFLTDRLPAMNMLPRDVSGAGDSMLTCTSLALVAGANIWQAAFMGSIAAAIQVSRLGNIPLTTEEILSEL